MDLAIEQGDELALALVRQAELEEELAKVHEQLSRAGSQLAEMRAEVAMVKRLSTQRNTDPVDAPPSDYWPAPTGEPEPDGATTSTPPRLNRAARRRLEREQRRRSERG